jgi:hypothetical protein
MEPGGRAEDGPKLSTHLHASPFQPGKATGGGFDTAAKPFVPPGGGAGLKSAGSSSSLGASTVHAAPFVPGGAGGGGEAHPLPSHCTSQPYPPFSSIVALICNSFSVLSTQPTQCVSFFPPHTRMHTSIIYTQAHTHTHMIHRCTHTYTHIIHRRTDTHTHTYAYIRIHAHTRYSQTHTHTYTHTRTHTLFTDTHAHTLFIDKTRSHTNYSQS